MTDVKQDFHKPDGLTLKWYFDACVLDCNIDQAVKEITNKTVITYISHLTLGEAYGNCLRKNFNKKEEEARGTILAFTKFIQRLRGFVCIVGNDNIDNVIDDLKEEGFRLSITDAMHLATAIINRCVVFRTTDVKDFGNNRKIAEYVAKKYNLPNFAISVMKPEKNFFFRF